MNKLPDVLERKDLSKLDGAEAFRVYELLPELEKNDTDEIYPRHLWSKEAKERENEDERLTDSGYQSLSSPNSSSADFNHPDSPTSTSDLGSETKSPNKEPVIQKMQEGNRQVLRTVTKNGPKIYAVLPSNLKIGANRLKKPFILTQIPFGHVGVKVRHIRFGIKYFGKEVFSWDFRSDKTTCRLTSSKQQIHVQYPRKDFCEKKLLRVSFKYN